MCFPQVPCVCAYTRCPHLGPAAHARCVAGISVRWHSLGSGADPKVLGTQHAHPCHDWRFFGHFLAISLNHYLCFIFCRGAGITHPDFDAPPERQIAAGHVEGAGISLMLAQFRWGASCTRKRRLHACALRTHARTHARIRARAHTHTSSMRAGRDERALDCIHTHTRISFSRTRYAHTRTRSMRRRGGCEERGRARVFRRTAGQGQGGWQHPRQRAPSRAKLCQSPRYHSTPYGIRTRYAHGACGGHAMYMRVRAHAHM